MVWIWILGFLVRLNLGIFHLWRQWILLCNCFWIVMTQWKIMFVNHFSCTPSTFFIHEQILIFYFGIPHDRERQNSIWKFGFTMDSLWIHSSESKVNPWFWMVKFSLVYIIVITEIYFVMFLGTWGTSRTWNERREPVIFRLSGKFLWPSVANVILVSQSAFRHQKPISWRSKNWSADFFLEKNIKVSMSSQSLPNMKLVVQVWRLYRPGVHCPPKPISRA